MYKEGSLEAAILEAVSPEQQAAIAIAKKKKMDEASLLKIWKTGARKIKIDGFVIVRAKNDDDVSRVYKDGKELGSFFIDDDSYELIVNYDAKVFGRIAQGTADHLDDVPGMFAKELKKVNKEETSVYNHIQEKAVSKQQQKFFGVVRAIQKGEGEGSPEAEKAAASMSKKDVKDFASTKHKDLPMKKEEMESCACGENCTCVNCTCNSIQEKYDVKTAKSKMGKISVKSFDSLDDAKAHLEKMKKMGHKGIISQDGKPVNEGSKEEYKKVFDAALKKFNVKSPADFKTDELKKKFFDYVDANYKAKDESYVAEAKNDYQIYHNMYSLAVQHAVQQAEKKGYTVDPDAYDRDVALGPRKPGDGKTNRFSLPLLKNGKPQKKMLHMQIYGMGNKYELNMYIEDYNPSLQESDMKSAMKKIVGKDVKSSTSGASGFQKTMYHVSDDMYVTFNDKSNLGDVYYKGKNVDSFRGVGTPDMEKVVKKYMKKYGVKSEESGKTMTGKPWAEIKVENKK